MSITKHGYTLNINFPFHNLKIGDIIAVECDHPHQNAFEHYWYQEDFKVINISNNEYSLYNYNFRIFVHGEKSHMHKYIGKYEQ